MGNSQSLSPKLGCWEPQLNVNMAFLDMNANKIGITEHRNQPRFYISLDNNFNLPKGWFFSTACPVRSNLISAALIQIMGECFHPHCLHTDSGTLWMFLHGKLLVMREMV